MTGAVNVLLSEAQATSSVGGAPNAMAWANIYGEISGQNAALTVAGITGGTLAPITAAITGAASIGYVLNGVVTHYTGAFNVQNGQTLAWQATDSAGASGTVTVTSGATAIGSFTYTITKAGP